LFVERIRGDNYFFISGVLALKEWLFFDLFQYLVGVDEHICIMHLVECGLVLLAQILQAQVFGVLECLAFVLARDLGRLLALVALLLMVLSDLFLGCNLLVPLLAASLRLAVVFALTIILI